MINHGEDVIVHKGNWVKEAELAVPGFLLPQKCNGSDEEWVG